MKRIGRLAAPDESGLEILKLDIARLVETRALVQGSSGSGKSWLIRGIVERAAADMPVIVLDLEGEFVTLRERFDVVLAGEGGEVAVDVRSASLFGRRLLELSLSAVVNLYDLKPQDKRAYVRRFLEGIMSAPRKNWGSRLIVLDEAHHFAPEGTQAESLGAVIDVASRGRKRGYGLIVATQRLSKLHKDVAAEMRNVFVGQTTLDVDVKRAVDLLGFASGRESRQQLRGLEHLFYAMGPALSAPGVVLFQADKPATTHPEGGARRALAPAAPSAKIKGVLGELADLAAKADQEEKDLAALRREVADLRRQLAAKPQPAADQATISRAVQNATLLAAQQNAKQIARIEKSLSSISGDLTAAGQALSNARSAVEAARAEAAPPDPDKNGSAEHWQPIAPGSMVRKGSDYPLTAAACAAMAADNERLPAGEAKVLAAIVQHGPLDRPHITRLAGYKRSSRDAYLNRLRNRGLIDDAAEGIVATEAGVAAAGDFEPLPSGRALAEYWLKKLPQGEAAILSAVLKGCEGGFGPVDRETLTELTGYQRSSRDAYIQRLKARHLVEAGREGISAAKILFD